MKTIIALLVIVILSLFIYNEQLDEDQKSFVDDKIGDLEDTKNKLDDLADDLLIIAEDESKKLYDLQTQLQNLDETEGTFTYNDKVYEIDPLFREVQKIDNVLTDINDILKESD